MNHFFHADLMGGAVRSLELGSIAGALLSVDVASKGVDESPGLQGTGIAYDLVSILLEETVGIEGGSVVQLPDTAGVGAGAGK